MVIVFYEQAYPEENVRQRKWRQMAEKLGIDIEVDERLAEERKRRELEKAHAEFMID